MPRAFITGITGFAGSHLAERAIARGYEVHGLAHDPLPHANLAAVASRVRVVRADVSDVRAVSEALAAARPDVVFHLAGQAIPSLAASDVRGAIRVNVEGTAAVVEALRAHPAARLVVASSAEVYGAPEQLPAREDAPLRPPNAYAATKVAAEAVARSRGDGAVTILRPVNQVGPRLHPLLVASAFARQIALAEAGQAEAVVRHGSLDAGRDLLDVRDMADAYLAAAQLEDGGTYNVGTGRAVKIAEVLRILVSLARIPLRTELDVDRVRAGDVLVFSVDAGAFRERTGWLPTVPLERSLADLLEWWREQVRAPVRA